MVKSNRTEYWKFARIVAKKTGVSVSTARHKIKAYVTGANTLLRKRNRKQNVTWRDMKKKMAKKKSLPDYYKDYWVEY